MSLQYTFDQTGFGIDWYFGFLLFKLLFCIGSRADVWPSLLLIPEVAKTLVIVPQHRNPASKVGGKPAKGISKKGFLPTSKLPPKGGRGKKKSNRTSSPPCSASQKGATIELVGKYQLFYSQLTWDISLLYSTKSYDFYLDNWKVLSWGAKSNWQQFNPGEKYWLPNPLVAS